MTSKEGAIFHIFRIHFFLKEAFQEFGLGNQTWTVENGVERNTGHQKYNNIYTYLDILTCECYTNC